MDEPSEKTRKTITLTHRQVGATGLVGLVVALAPYLKETFVSQAEGAKLTMEVSYMRQDLTELKSAVDKMPDKIDSIFKENAKQVRRDVDRNEKRVENLEAYVFRSRAKNL